MIAALEFIHLLFLKITLAKKRERAVGLEKILFISNTMNIPFG